MSKFISIITFCILLFAVSCSDDSNTGPEEINKYTALKKAKYTNCEITLGEHSYTYVFANPDSIWFIGSKLYINHKVIDDGYVGQIYHREGDEAYAKLILDFETSQILLFEYSYSVYHDKNEHHDDYDEGYNHDTTIDARIVRIPFQISRDSVITAELNNDLLTNKLIEYALHEKHYIRLKDNFSRVDTVYATLPNSKKLFKLKVW